MDQNMLAIARRYADAVTVQDFPALSSLFADDIVWHQAGNRRFSGTYRGRTAAADLVAAFWGAG